MQRMGEGDGRWVAAPVPTQAVLRRATQYAAPSAP